jgi:hypothetical protein
VSRKGIFTYYMYLATFSENVAGQQNGQLLRIIATRNQK